ncbi:MAG: DMT family transporter [Phenylobacterium sp.]|uniref:DMT family transporter n=1 Tax=Phenylobacterium sp. TaxID=1871053 RepID=UPI002732EBEB|nr:DMT family transporter [Phenylobacterium sp.]MDP3174128.1 DMT family transporter [Phenylobacterium sp.]
MTDAPAPAAGSRGKALAALIFGAAVIGLAPILARLTETGPAAAGAWRLSFALPMLAVIALRTAPGSSLRPHPAALLAGVMFALDMGFWHYSLAYTSVANATVLTNLTPVVVTAVAWFAFGQRPRPAFLAAVALAVAGAALMTVGREGAAGRNPPLGDGLALTTALWYAFYMLAIGVARRTQAATMVMFWSSLVGMPLLFIAAAALGEDIIPRGAAGWAACVGLGVVHVAGQGAIAWALGRLETATASVVILVQPVVAAILGWLLFAEAVGRRQAVGAALALGGVILAQRVAGTVITSPRTAKPAG